MTCEKCGQQVPDDAFCTRCGAHQGVATSVGGGASRLHRYAAHPGEHVGTPNVLTTLLPHATGQKVHEFRLAALGGIAVVGVLSATGLVAAALVVAAVLVPILYLMYLYEAQVYRDEPVRVVGLTLGAGLALGLGFTLVADRVAHPVVSASGYLTFGDELVATVVVPVIQLAILAIPALVLMRLMPKFTETADGLVFGVAAGLGFAATETLVRYSSVISSLPVRTDAADWIYPLLTVTVFIPLLHGSAAGLIAASLWRGAPRGRSRPFAALGIPVAAAGTVAFYLVNQILADHGVAAILQLGWQALAVLALVVFVRYLLHNALLDEAVDLGYAPATCAGCHRHVMAIAFCPGCGRAVTAAPRRAPLVATVIVTTAVEGG